MSDQGKRDDFRLGFLTSVEDEERGIVGGLLVTNRYGRPLEFQCTTPVKPNRTQTILYGDTLKPYLLGEIIGRTLVDKIGVKPHLILAEHPELLDLRNHISLPVACVCTGSRSEKSEDQLPLGKQILRFHNAHLADRKSVQSHADQIPDSADLHEPFDRVREALQETIKIAAR